VEVEFHPPVKIAMFGTRKALAEHCHAVIRAGLVAANLGRADAGATAPLAVKNG
jgi:1-acyl-sn-glycerol-3-phosphate acyltransferase